MTGTALGCLRNQRIEGLHEEPSGPLHLLGRRRRGLRRSPARFQTDRTGEPLDSSVIWVVVVIKRGIDMILGL